MYHAMACLTVPKLSNLGEHSEVSQARSLHAAKTLKIFKNLLEIARIYKALKRFADLQGPLCYNDAQNKEMNLIVY